MLIAAANGLFVGFTITRAAQGPGTVRVLPPLAVSAEGCCSFCQVLGSVLPANIFEIEVGIVSFHFLLSSSLRVVLPYAAAICAVKWQNCCPALRSLQLNGNSATPLRRRDPYFTRLSLL